MFSCRYGYVHLHHNFFHLAAGYECMGRRISTNPYVDGVDVDEFLPWYCGAKDRCRINASFSNWKAVPTSVDHSIVRFSSVMVSGLAII